MRLFREGKGGEVRAGSKVDKKTRVAPFVPSGGKVAAVPQMGRKGSPFAGVPVTGGRPASFSGNRLQYPGLQP